MKLTPVNKGAKSHSDELELVMCDIYQAFYRHLQTFKAIIHCNCKTGCRGNFFRSRIYLLPYSSACGSCQVTDYENQILSEILSNDED